VLTKNNTISALCVGGCGIGKKGIVMLGLALQTRTRPSQGFFKLENFGEGSLSSVWAELLLPACEEFEEKLRVLVSNDEILELWWQEEEWRKKCEAFCMSSHDRLGQMSCCTSLDVALHQMVLSYLPKPGILEPLSRFYESEIDQSDYLDDDDDYHDDDHEEDEADIDQGDNALDENNYDQDQDDDNWM